MGFNFSALGGLIQVSCITNPETDVLSDEYLDYLKGRLEDSKEEVQYLQEVIDVHCPNEEGQVNEKNDVNDDDIPYEVRMKYIIDAYRKDQEKWGKLAEYAKHLESEVIRLKNILIVNGYSDSGNEEDSKPAKKIIRLQEEVKTKDTKLREQKIKIKELKKILYEKGISY